MEPVANPGGERFGDERRADTEQVRGERLPVAQDEESSLEQDADFGFDEVSPRLRGRRRHDRHANDPNPRVGSSSPSNRSQPTIDALAAAAASGESISPSAAQVTAAPTQTVKSVEPTIVNVQSIASTVNRSVSASGPNTGTRGSTQAIESMTATREFAEVKPNSRTANSKTSETVSRVKLIQRVSKAFQHLGPEGGVIRLRLAPAEMGSVRVEMRIQQRAVQARVVADTEATTTALREHLPDLRARLESFGMQVDKIEIETETNDASHQGHQFDAESQQQAVPSRTATKPFWNEWIREQCERSCFTASFTITICESRRSGIQWR